MNKRLVLKPSVLAVALAIGTTQFAVAQDSATTATAATATPTPATQTVYITGSNLRRSDTEGTSPISVLNAQDIKNTGATTVSELMRFVPSMGTDSNHDNGSGSGFAKGVATASLRGLGSSSTLVLLNGRRITPAPYADPNEGNSVLYDLNSIPISAIERVEVLQDGASAVYGSDAIAGVINFILKKNYEGTEVAARYSANDNNQFRNKGFNAIFGKGNLDTDGYNFMVTADVTQRDPTLRIDAKDVEFSQLQLLNGRYLSPYGSSVSQYPTYYKETRSGSKNFGVTQATAPANMLFNTSCPTNQQITGSVAGNGFLPTNTLVGRTFCNFDVTPFQEAQGYGRDANLISHGEIKLGESGVVAFADAAYSRTRRDYKDVPISIGTGVTTNWTATGPGASYQTILPIGHPDNPFPNARASLAYRFTNLRGGSSTINEGKRALAGLQGSHFGWNWESALLWNRAENESTTYGRLFLPTLNKLMTQNLPIAQVAADPTIGHDVLTQNTSQITQWDAKANTEFGHLPGGTIGFAAGVELRREKVDLAPDPLVATGQIFGLANTILSSSRDVKSAFVELGAPVLKNLSFDFAGRVDKYPNLKSNFVPKVGGKWTVTDTFAVRGTYAEGFRAPSLSQIVPGGAQFFLNNTWDPKRCEEDEITPKPNGTTADCAKSVGGTGGFNPNLKPETSKSYNLGFIWSPSSKFDVTMDFWKIKRENEIVLGSAADALRNEDLMPANVVRDPNPVNFITDASGKPISGTGPLVMIYTPWMNQGMTELRGVDIEGHLRNNFGEWGSLSTTLRSTYTSKYYIQTHPGDPIHNVVGTIQNIYDWSLNSGTPIPRWKSSVSSTWKLADHAVNLSLNYVGPISYLRVYDGATTYPQPFCQYSPKGSNTIPLYTTFYPDCSIKEWVTVGLGYTYTGFKHWTLNANIQNLNDEKAPYDPGNTAVGYNESLHNPYGRYYSLSARYTF
ncbi:TonB-dependent receptor domain-containing protein [Massilia sp. 9096]|uniref:TonB-dependent receptor domain-containing protein n=1 Tax=Massilia sp. 9096 TaxID=1500894 RepID=UPI001EFC2AD8|nr:TonB-dependent receptor [Massilia sp. 9096]